MAGDWIKIEENMPDKPEVCRIAARLGIDGDAVAGKLLRIWAWASRNCNADGVTSVTVKSYLDRLAAVTGFADAMVESGWLTVDGENLMFPNFDRHCSQTAKDRANTNRRVARHRESGNAAGVTNVTLEALQKPLPEKRREEKSIKTLVATVVAPTEKPEQTDAEWLAALMADPTYSGIDVKTEHGKLCRWCEVNRKQPTRRRFINWLGRCEKPMAVTRGLAMMPVLENLRND